MSDSSRMQRLFGVDPGGFARGAMFGLAIGVVVSLGLAIGITESRDAASATTPAPKVTVGADWFQPSPALAVNGVRLPDVSPAGHGRLFRIRAQPGGLLVVFFGYTFCPDICPLTLANLASIERHLGPDAKRVSVAFITVDPRRDKPAKLDAYIGTFLHHYHALRPASRAQLAIAESAFNAESEIVGNPNSKTYTINHTATVFAVDARSRVAIEWAHDAPAASIAHELRRLLAATPAQAKQPEAS